MPDRTDPPGDRSLLAIPPRRLPSAFALRPPPTGSSKGADGERSGSADQHAIGGRRGGPGTEHGLVDGSCRG